MKKFLLLIASAFAITSCAIKDAEAPDPNLGALNILNSVLFQNRFALDPFNVAFRLNTLIVEADAVGGDIAAVPASVRDRLFGEKVLITLDAQGFYTIEYKGVPPKGDNLREGKVMIRTNGYHSLTESNAVWDILMTEENPYYFGWGVNLLKFSANMYYIRHTTDNEWEIKVENFVSELGNSEEETRSDWNAQYILKQTGVDQTLNSISKSTYSLSLTSYNTKTMSTADRYDITTYSPMRYNSECEDPYTVMGDGFITIASTANAAEYSENQWMGKTLTECRPSVGIKYKDITSYYQY